MKKYGKSNIPKKKSQKLNYNKRRAKIKYYSYRFPSGKDIFTRMIDAHENDLRAEIIRQLALEAERLEEKMNADGFVLPENIHNLIQEQKNREKGATQKTLDSMRRRLDRNRLIGAATYQIDNYKKAGKPYDLKETFDTGLKYRDYISNNSAELGRKLNKVIKDSGNITSSIQEDLSVKIYALVNNEKDFKKNYDNKEGYEDDEIIIKPGWNGTPEKFAEYVKFKKFRMYQDNSKGYLLDIFRDPYSNEALHELYIDTVNETTYYKFIDEMGLDLVTADELEFLMNTSHAWSIAYQYANEDSERAKTYWQNLGNKLNSLRKEGMLPIDFYDDICKAIVNEEDYVVITQMIDQAITTAHKYRD